MGNVNWPSYQSAYSDYLWSWNKQNRVIFILIFIWPYVKENRPFSLAGQIFFLRRGTNENCPIISVILFFWINSNSLLLLLNRLLQVAPKWRIESVLKKTLLLIYKRILKKYRTSFFGGWGGGGTSHTNPPPWVRPVYCRLQKPVKQSEMTNVIFKRWVYIQLL